MKIIFFWNALLTTIDYVVNLLNTKNQQQYWSISWKVVLHRLGISDVFVFVLAILSWCSPPNMTLSA